MTFGVMLNSSPTDAVSSYEQGRGGSLVDLSHASMTFSVYKVPTRAKGSEQPTKVYCYYWLLSGRCEPIIVEKITVIILDGVAFVISHPVTSIQPSEDS